MRKLALFSFLLVFVAVIVSGQQKRNLTVDDFAALRNVSSPQLSPDGKIVAYVVETMNLKEDKKFTDIYMVPFTGGEEIQLTSDEFDNTHPKALPNPKWSPDSQSLAYLAKKKGKSTQVFLVKRAGGVETQLTDVKQDILDFDWSPDGKKLALIMTDLNPDDQDDEEKVKEKEKTTKPIVVTRIQFKFDETGFYDEFRDHLYVFDIQTKGFKQITSGHCDDSEPRWSPDGSQILFVSNRTENADTNRNTDLFLVPAAGGDPRKLTANNGPDFNPDWSPDGKWIAYLTGLNPDIIYYDTTELAIIPAAGGESRSLTRELDRTVLQPKFSPDGKSVYFLLEDQGTQRLASVSIKGGNFNKKASTENVLAEYDLNANGLIYTASRQDLPYEIFAINPKQKLPAQITKVNSKILSQVQMGKVELIQFKSQDGTPVAGYVVKPPNFNPAQKYPLINWIHGGPVSQYTDEFDFGPQLFAANGYVVTLINYRGSSGYGEEFCKSIWADWGNKEYDDLMAGVDYVISQGYVDPDHMGVGGWSYGGILTDWTIYKTTRFKAASSGAGIANVLAGYGTDHYQFEYEKELGFPWENLDGWLKVSAPFLKLNQIKTPTLFMCGEKDWNVPLINSEQMYQGLRRLGIETMLIIYPGQPHSLLVPSYIQDRYQRYLAWFGYYLKGDANKVPPEQKKEVTKEVK